LTRGHETVEFHEYLGSLPSEKYIDTHRVRYLRTMDWLEPLLERAASILEIGPRSPITTYLVEYRGLSVDNVERDLRYPFEAADQSYDLVLNMEVIEHLKDRDEDNVDYRDRTRMTWSGIKSCLSECQRVLVPGGAMLCTTPNPSSTSAIQRVLAYQVGMVYAPHVRELSLSELVIRLGEAGFEVVRLETH
jgi:hypothetical protein